MNGANPQSAPRAARALDGILAIDKPVGWTSHDVVARVRKILNTRRVGHTGTLDPFATGVLVVCVNRATRLVQFLTGDDKEYVATMRLGFGTDTGDLTGAPNTPLADVSGITPDRVREAFQPFLGHIRQVPPMYSAKKIGGVKLYELARRGEKIERPPVEVEIREIELLNSGNTAGPGVESGDPIRSEPGEYSFRVVCSSGTYIRTLAEEIGKVLGVGAHLIRLRRTRAGKCSLSGSVTLEKLNDLAQSGQTHLAMVSMADAVALPVLQVGQEDCKRISHGRSFEHPVERAFPNGTDSGEPGEQLADRTHGALAKICDKKNQLIAVAEYDASKILWRPRVVLID
jgi:tRNA pseudouridine55 synthase